jgi:hypothetical protein
LSTYGIHLHEVGQPGGYPVAYAADLLDALPRSSAIYRALDPATQWGYIEHILASIDYGVKAVAYMLGKGKGKRPKPIEPPRPRRQATAGVSVAAELDKLERLRSRMREA